MWGFKDNSIEIWAPESLNVREIYSIVGNEIKKSDWPGNWTKSCLGQYLWLEIWPRKISLCKHVDCEKRKAVEHIPRCSLSTIPQSPHLVLWVLRKERQETLILTLVLSARKYKPSVPENQEDEQEDQTSECTPSWSPVQVHLNKCGAMIVSFFLNCQLIFLVQIFAR